MINKEVLVKLKCIESDWTHDIYLYFENEESYSDFTETIKTAKKSENYTKVEVKAQYGLIENSRHFLTDIKKYSNFEAIIGRDTIIKNVSMEYEEDGSKKAEYGKMLIKDIAINFKNNNCNELSEI
ncbi:MAG: hypothetical protein IJF03_10020 [Lachnospiraceae bacterium]|nr:hypothetical protein [Lachnospiraceae bacterium]